MTKITDPWGSAAALLARLLMGSYMAIAGWTKISDGLAAWVRTRYAETTPGWLPDFVAVPYGYALPFIELLGGVLLIVGLFTRMTALILAGLLASIVIAVGPAFLKGPPFHHALMMAGLAVLIAAVGGGMFSVDAVLRKK